MEPSKIKPAPIHLTLLLLNNFVISSSDFINKFAENVENKLSSISRKVTDVEILLSVLEAKLNSIPDLDHIKPKEVAPPPEQSNSSNSNSNINNNNNNSSSSSSSSTSNSNSNSSNDSNSSSSAAASAPAAPPNDMIKASEHPAYAQFLKMLRLGIPQPVVIQKLQAAGLDLAPVDNPDMLIPREGPIPSSSSAAAPAPRPPANESSSSSSSSNSNNSNNNSDNNNNNNNNNDSRSNSATPVSGVVPAAVASGGMIKASEHPDYMPFLKMLRVGVPVPVVIGKLSAAGLNVEAASNPDMLIPA